MNFREWEKTVGGVFPSAIHDFVKEMAERQPTSQLKLEYNHYDRLQRLVYSWVVHIRKPRKKDVVLPMEWSNSEEHVTSQVVMFSRLT